MKLRERLDYAEKMLNSGKITTSDQYMKIVNGDDMEQLEDKIAALEDYLLYKRLHRVDTYE